MKKASLTLLTIVFTLFAKAEGDGHTLTVVIKNFKNTEGSARVTYFISEEDFLQKGKGQVVEIDNQNELKVVFEDVQKGIVAVSVVHDENGNGELDTALFGIPTEDYGFSNDAKGSFGPPSFEDCQFEVDNDKTIEININ